jgi:hypothetical protein
MDMKSFPERRISVPVTASKDDASAADQAAITKIEGSRD